MQGSLNHNFLLIFQSLMTVTGQTERWMGDGHKKLIRKPTKSIGLFWPPLLGLVQTSCSHLHISIYLSTSPHISIHISMSWCRHRRLCVHHKLSAKQRAYTISGWLRQWGPAFHENTREGAVLLKFVIQ